MPDEQSQRKLMKTITNLILLAAALVGVSSCANTSVTKIGTVNHVPLPEGTAVAIFTAENEVKQAFVIVGVISYEGPGKNQKVDLGEATEPLKEKARAAGGNAIIIDNIRPINSGIASKSGIVSTRIYVQARAVQLIK